MDQLCKQRSNRVRPQATVRIHGMSAFGLGGGPRFCAALLLLLDLLIPLRLLEPRPLLRFVTADQATGGGAEKSVVHGVVARNATY